MSSMYEPPNAPPPSQESAPTPVYGGGTPRKKKRIFMWVFLVIQVLFIIWIIFGISGTNDGGLAECAGTSDPSTCRSAYNVGAGIGLALIIGVWCVVDFLLGVGYAVYRLAKRP